MRKATHLHLQKKIIHHLCNNCWTAKNNRLFCLSECVWVYFWFFFNFQSSFKDNFWLFFFFFTEKQTIKFPSMYLPNYLSHRNPDCDRRCTRESFICPVMEQGFPLWETGVILSVSPTLLYIWDRCGVQWKQSKNEELVKWNWKTLESSGTQMDLIHGAVCQHSSIASHINAVHLLVCLPDSREKSQPRQIYGF